MSVTPVMTEGTSFTVRLKSAHPVCGSMPPTHRVNACNRCCGATDAAFRDTGSARFFKCFTKHLKRRRWMLRRDIGGFFFFEKNKVPIEKNKEEDFFLEERTKKRKNKEETKKERKEKKKRRRFEKKEEEKSHLCSCCRCLFKRECAC